VLFEEAGNPYLQTHAINHIAWSDDTRNLNVQHAQNMKFRNVDNIFGKVMTSGKYVIDNHPSSNSRRERLPKGPPSLKAFLRIKGVRNLLIDLKKSWWESPPLGRLLWAAPSIMCGTEQMGARHF